MKIISTNKPVSEKKTISPLTIKKIKELNISYELPKTYEELNIKKVNDEDIKVENLKDGMIIEYQDGSDGIVVKRENFENAFSKSAKRILEDYHDSKFFFISMEYGCLIYMPSSNYKNGKNCLTCHENEDGSTSIINLYESSINTDMIETFEDMENLLALIHDNI